MRASAFFSRRSCARRPIALASLIAALALGCGDDTAPSDEDTGTGSTSSSTDTSSITVNPTGTGPLPTSTETSSSDDASSTDTVADSSGTDSNGTEATGGTTTTDPSSSDDSGGSSSESTGSVEIVPFYATYLGETDLHDQLRSTALDDDGNLYFVGGAYSPGLACDGVHAGDMDVIVGKVDAGGSLSWCRYLGGSGYDRFYDLEVNADGSQIVIGVERAPGFR